MTESHFCLTRILIAVVIALCLGARTVHGSAETEDQGHPDAASFLKKAEQARIRADKARQEKKADQEEAAFKEQLDSLISYLELKPDDLEAREALCLLRADHVQDAKSFTQAYEELSKLLRSDPKRTKARRKLVELAMLARRYDEARNQLEQYLLRDKPDDAELLDLLGQCQEKMNELETAAKSYRKAVEIAPDQIHTYQRLAALLGNRLSNPKEAYNCMQNMLSRNPNSAKAYICLGTYWEGVASKGQAKKAAGQDLNPRAEAMKAAEKALQLSPDDQDGLSLATRSAVALSKFDQARKYAERNVELHKGVSQCYTTLAGILMRTSDKEKAVEILDRGLKEGKDAPEILWYKANVLLDLKKTAEAKDAAEKLKSSAYPKFLIEYVEARLAFAQKDWAEAIRRFEKVRPSLTSMPDLLGRADLALGYSYGQLHDADRAVRCYKQALETDPSSSAARQGLAEGFLALGQVDNAVEEYGKLVKTGNAPTDWLTTYGGLLIRQNLMRDRAKQQWEPVEKVLAEAEKANADDVQLVLLRAEMLRGQNRNQDAERLLRKALQSKPAKLELWKSLANLLALQRKWDQAERVMDESKRLLGDTVEQRLARSEYLLLRHDTKAGPYLTKLSDKIDEFSEADQIRLLEGLLNSARRINDNNAAGQLLALLSRKDKKNLEYPFLRIEMAANSQSLGAMEKALADVEETHGKGPLWMFGRARLLALKATQEEDPKLYDEALKNLVQARQLRPSWPRIPLLMGQIYDQQKRFAPALRNYLEAIDLSERNPAALRRVLQLLSGNRLYGDPDILLHQLDSVKKCLAEGNAGKEDCLNLALAYLEIEKRFKNVPLPGLRAGTSADAAAAAWASADNLLRYVVSGTDDPRYLAAYAKALLDHGELSKSEVYVNRLAKNDSHAAATVILQARVYCKRSQHENALQILNGFVDQKDAVPTDRFQRIKMMAEALEQLCDSLDDPGQKPAADKYARAADKLWLEYVEGLPSEAMGYVAFLNRRGQTENAIAYLEKNRQNVSDLSLTQVCMEITKNGKGPREITERVENILKDAQQSPSSSGSDHSSITLTLGDLCAAQGRFAEAGDYCRDIPRQSTNYIAAQNNLAAILAVQGKDLDAALEAVNQAIAKAGAAGWMLDTRACVYIAQRDADNALADSEQAVEDSPKPVRLFHRARALLLAGQTDAARSTMQKALGAGLSTTDLYEQELGDFDKLKKIPEGQRPQVQKPGEVQE
jgi:tetratricopeptide (TPR) repeat protein